MNQSSQKIVIFLTIMSTINIITSAQNKSWPIVTRSSRSLLPPDLLAQAQDTKLSVLKPSSEELTVLYQNYPHGSALFTGNNDLIIKFNTLIQAIQKNPEVIEFLRKIHIKSLNQLYAYIMKIYTNLNLTNPGITQNNSDQTSTNLADYFSDEAQYAINKKKLIMNHFLNVIQAQFSSLIIACIPKIPVDLASAFGQMFIENDHGINLTDFTTRQTDPMIIEEQAKTLKILEAYINFFQAYTKHLNIIDETGTNQYFTLALAIQNYIKNPAHKMNPSMFFYDVETMRSIRFIPFIASTLEKNTKLIPWAPSVVNAATKNLTMNGHEIAYFKDALGKKTQNFTQAQSLFLLTEVGQNLFEEELLPQPGWLNNQAGSIRILSACLGDISALIGMGILDETIESILKKVRGKQVEISRMPIKPITKKK